MTEKALVIRRPSKNRAGEKAMAATVRSMAPREFGLGGLAYASRALPGGKASLIELARLSSKDCCKAVVADWDAMTKKRRAETPLERICEGVSVLPAEFLGETVAAAFEHNTDIAKLIAAVNMPRVVAATVKNAIQQKGFKDREMLFKQGGLIVTPGGQQIQIHTEAKAGAQAVVVPEQTHGLPKFEHAMLASASAVRGQE